MGATFAARAALVVKLALVLSASTPAFAQELETPPAEPLPEQVDAEATPSEVPPPPAAEEAASETPPQAAPEPRPTAPEALDETQPSTPAPIPLTEPAATSDTRDSAAVAAKATYPRFEPSLRLMTGFEWSREQRLGASERVETEDYGFFLSQVRVQLEGELSKRLTAEISADLADGYDAAADRPVYLRDAFANLRLKRAFQIRMGHFKRPLSALELRSSGVLQVRGRGLTNDLVVEDNAWGGRALGAELWGKLKVIPATWALGAFNPLWTASAATRPKGVDVIARATLEPVEGLRFGANGGLKRLDTPPFDGYDTFFAAGGDVQVKGHGFSLLVDALYAELPLPAADIAEQAAFGVVALMSYDIPLSKNFSLQPVILGEYSDASVEHAKSETVRGVLGLNLIGYETLRLMPQVEVVDWLGEPSSFSPPQSISAYLMLSLAL